MNDSNSGLSDYKTDAVFRYIMLALLLTFQKNALQLHHLKDSIVLAEWRGCVEELGIIQPK